MTDSPSQIPMSEGRASAGTTEAPTNALRLVAVLIRERRVLWRYPLAVTVVVVLISFLFPNEYRSSVSILPPERDFQSMSMPVGDLKMLVAGGMSLPLMATASDILAAVLASRTVRDSTVTRLGLDRRWSLPFDRAANRLNANSGVKVASTGVVEVWAIDRDRHFSDTLVNAMVDEADQLNRAIVNTKARRTREFVEGRLSETKAQLDSATHALEEFQRLHRTVALEAQVTAMVGNAAKLKAQLAADEIELSVLEGSLSEGHYRIQQLRTRVRETRRQLEDMESSAMGDSSAAGSIDIAGLPRLAKELAERLRDVKVAETLYTLLTEQYENARIQERRDTPSFSILDRAAHGGTKVRPRRLLIGIGTFVVAISLMLTLVLIREYFNQLAVTDPAKHRSFVAVWESLRSGRTARRN
jgi:tyrosine-protein kinase Etk/Wzc